MIRNLVFAACLFVSIGVLAESKAIQIPIEAGQNLKISGYRGQVELVAGGDAHNIRVNIQQLSTSGSGWNDETQSSLNNWGPIVENRDKLIEIKFRESASREFWAQKGIVDAIPNYKIQISGAALPTEIYLLKGSVLSKNWKSTLSITLNQGDVELSQTEGDAKVYVQSGSIRLNEHKGGVDIASYDAKISTRSITGNVGIDNFIGQSSLENIEGNLRIASYNGKSKVSNVKGSVNFDLKVGSLDVDALDGALRGDNGDGLIKAHMTSAPDVRIRSQAGTVNIRVPRKYSAHLNVGSVEGDLRVPGHIRVQRGDSMRFAVGRLNGGEKEGQIFARSQTGTILINPAE